MEDGPDVVGQLGKNRMSGEATGCHESSADPERPEHEIDDEVVSNDSGEVISPALGVLPHSDKLRK